jgi:L-amino acid N-acyltransferase YncA
MIYHIDITNGTITVDRDPTDKRSIKQWFADRAAGLSTVKPAPTRVKGWPFALMYITHGDNENGQAIAKAKRQ